MKGLLVSGGERLRGEVRIQGAKNSVLPILAATVLHSGVSVLEDCPRLSDVDTAVTILEELGAKTAWQGHTLTVDASTLDRCAVSETLMREMRSSVIFLGALLARFGEAELFCPGGCDLGPRPIDLHLRALRELGAEITPEGGSIRARAKRLTAAELTLDLPSVGATENAILAAVGAEGITVIRNAAREPEIVDLQCFLRSLGVKIRGGGSSCVTVAGAAALRDGHHRVMPDRIVAATYLAAGAACGGASARSGAGGHGRALLVRRRLRHVLFAERFPEVRQPVRPRPAVWPDGGLSLRDDLRRRVVPLPGPDDGRHTAHPAQRHLLAGGRGLPDGGHPFFASGKKNEKPCSHRGGKMIYYRLTFRTGEENMSQHRSLRGSSKITSKRNVLKRFERVNLLQKRGDWKEGDRGLGLKKTKPEA